MRTILGISGISVLLVYSCLPAQAACNYWQCLGQCALPGAGVVACSPRVAYCSTHCDGRSGRSRNSFGAIAYSPSSGSYGYSDRYPDREQAESRANKECGRNDCVAATWFFGHCGALATSSNGAWGSDQDTSEQKAQSLAQARCTSQGGTNCVILVSHCSP
jgi:serine/threonine-protein kinase